MKKEYSRPEICVIEVDTECIMCVSVNPTVDISISDDEKEYGDSDDGTGGSWVSQR